MSTRKLTIEKPCDESWAGMTSQENGRHCAKCEKTVVDFTGMPGSSILQFLDEAQGEVCGRIRPSQMTISVPRLVDYNRQPEFSLRAVVLGLALTTFCALNAVAQTETVKGKIAVEQVQQQDKQSDPILTQYTVSVRMEDSSRVDSATVLVYFADGSLGSYFSDSLGVCRFATERAIANLRVIKDWDWESRFYFLSDFDSAHTLAAVLEKREMEIMGVMIERPVESPGKPGKKKRK